jgi:hypothetical protein
MLKATGKRWSILKGHKKAIGKYPNNRHQSVGEKAELLSGYWQKCGNFHPFSLKGCISVYIYFTSKELCTILKILGGSFPIFALSNHTTFSHTQTGATVPLTLQ